MRVANNLQKILDRNAKQKRSPKDRHELAYVAGLSLQGTINLIIGQSEPKLGTAVRVAQAVRRPITHIWPSSQFLREVTSDTHGGD